MKQYLKKIYRRLILNEKKRILQPPTTAEIELIEEIKEEFKNLTPIDTTSLVGAELEWANNMNDFRLQILKNDPRDFLQWELIRHIMFIGNPKYIKHEITELKKDINFTSVWSEAIEESEIGLPTKYPDLEKSSGNLIHHAYHLLNIEKEMNLPPGDTDIVFEFGGGYGSMCRLFMKLGFKGKYIIFDLPAFSALQRYYLKSLGYKILKLEDYYKADSGILCLSEIEELNTALYNSNLEKNSLFLATWSISETPINFRNKIMEIVLKFNYLFIAYQKQFNEMDNLIYFNNFKLKNSNYDWSSVNLSHIPGEHYYLFGQKKSGVSRNTPDLSAK